MSRIRVRVGTLNLHAAAVRRDLPAVLGFVVDLFEQDDLDVLGCQEAGEWGTMRRDLERHGLGLYRGEGRPGQAATPIVYPLDGFPVLATHSHPLTRSTPVGEAGAGPDNLKAKHLNTVTLGVGGRRLTIANMHGPASTWVPIRRRLAHEFYTDAAEALDGYRGLVIGLGDLNGVPGSKVLDPLFDPRDRGGAGLVSSHTVLGEIPTLRRRAIDHSAHRVAPGRIELLAHHSLGANRPFDHVGLGADYAITVRR